MSSFIRDTGSGIPARPNNMMERSVVLGVLGLFIGLGLTMVNVNMGLLTALMSLGFAAFGIRCSSTVDPYWQSGRYNESQSMANSAKSVTRFGFILLITMVALTIFLSVVG